MPYKYNISWAFIPHFYTYSGVLYPVHHSHTVHTYENTLFHLYPFIFWIYFLKKALLNDKLMVLYSTAELELTTFTSASLAGIYECRYLVSEKMSIMRTLLYTIRFSFSPSSGYAIGLLILLWFLSLKSIIILHFRIDINNVCFTVSFSSSS